jgi:hypothetical protein
MTRPCNHCPGCGHFCDYPECSPDFHTVPLPERERTRLEGLRAAALERELLEHAATWEQRRAGNS